MDFNEWFGKLVVAIHEENIAMLEDLFIYMILTSLSLSLFLFS